MFLAFIASSSDTLKHEKGLETAQYSVVKDGESNLFGNTDPKSIEPENSGEQEDDMPYFDEHEWAQRSRSLRSISCIYKNPDKFEKNFVENSIADKTNVEMLRQKQWFSEVRNHLDKLTESQMEDLMSLVRKNWIYLEAPDPKPTSSSLTHHPQIDSISDEESDNDEKKEIEEPMQVRSISPPKPPQKLGGINNNTGRRPAMKSAPVRNISKNQAANNKLAMSRDIKAALDEAWFKHLYLLFHYESLHGTINIPVNEVMVEDGIEYKVGEWLLTQRELLDYLRDNDYEKYDILESLVMERGLWMAADDNYKPKHQNTEVSKNRNVNSTSKPKVNNKRTASVIENNRKPTINKSAEPKGAVKKVVATKSVPTTSSKVKVPNGKRNTKGRSKSYDSDENESEFEEDEEDEVEESSSSESEEEESEDEERVVAPKKNPSTGRITPRSTKSQGFVKPESTADRKTRKVRRTSSKKLSANETESEGEESDHAGSDAEVVNRTNNRSKNIRAEKQTVVVDLSSSDKNGKKGLDHAADSKGTGRSSSESIGEVVDGHGKSRTFGSSLPRDGAITSSPQSSHQNDQSARSTRSRFKGSSSSNGSNGNHQQKKHDYAAFVYAVDESTHIYLGIGLVTNQYMEDGSMTFNMQVLKSMDPTKFFQSEFRLQANESATVKAQHIAVSDIKFIGGKEFHIILTIRKKLKILRLDIIDGIGGKLDVDSKNRMLAVMKSAPNLRIET